ncbi:hypothetical protein CKM354_000810700 [Cercospora kikuchii]|uniref:Uncharacterized protein n=1 Tax=Cercospora kikuchii TaxID=84275 RepID=A0A9P3CV77_9PEZI|nr:uncharacterized protein CKM354_000810700 [Cercospora kikuchii]GIZ44923.1 hypothetical protein CKM354_000810700 [Cercospora kikuchii]
MWIELDKTKRMAQITATTTINNPYQADQSFINQSINKTSPTTTSAKLSSKALMKSPNRADTFGSDTTAASTSSKLTWKSTTSSQTQSNKNKNKTYKPKKPKAQTVQFSDVGRHSNQWLFNDMSISDAVKTLFGKK